MAGPLLSSGESKPGSNGLRILDMPVARIVPHASQDFFRSPHASILRQRSGHGKSREPRTSAKAAGAALFEDESPPHASPPDRAAVTPHDAGSNLTLRN